MPGTASQRRIEKKNLKKVSLEEKVIEHKPPEQKPVKSGNDYCLSCRQFQKHPSGYCKLLKEHRARKQGACDKFDRR
jgi:hypothetical protein